MKNIYAPLIGFVIYVMVAMLTACSADPHYKIGISQCSGDDWRAKMNDEITREALFHDDVSVEIRSANDDNSRQIADIEYFIDNNFDAIVVAPNEAEAITPVVAKAYDAGIPVLVFDRNINGSKLSAFQGADNFAIGKAAAEYLSKHIPAGKALKVVEIYGLKGSTPADERHRGFAEQADSLSNLTVVAVGYGNWNAPDASRVADSLLTMHPDANVVYAHNDRMAIAASEVARRKGRDVMIVGVDAAPAIGLQAVADGIIDATFMYPTEGGRLLNTALALASGQPYDSLVMLPTGKVITDENATNLILKNNELLEETGRLNRLKSQLDDYWERHSLQTTMLYVILVAAILLVGIIFLLLRAYWQNKQKSRLQARNLELMETQRDMQVQLNTTLEETTRSKLSFFTNVSHDLRTPLTLIADPLSQLAEADNLTPQQSTLLTVANKNVRILQRLINQILDFRKFESGMLKPELSENDLNACLNEWCKGFEIAAAKRHLHFSVDDKATDGLTVALDTQMIERVVFNLLSNAFKFTPENGSVTISTGLDSELVTIKISDTGKGIAADDLLEIFNRFYQVDRVHHSGSGIGLALVKAFVELHEGTIGVESEPGRGATFVVTLPLRHVDSQSEAPRVMSITDVELEVASVDVEPVAPDPDKPTVLAIDDNADLLKLLRSVLSADFNVLTAANGADGLRLASKYVPDLIVCDMMMPVMDGLECLSRLKSEVATSHIPVLMLTAGTLDEQRMSTYESGADGFMVKPFDRRMLLSRCHNLIDNRRRLLDGRSNPVSTQSDRPSAPAPVSGSVRSIDGADIDNEFYNRFLTLFNERMGDSELSVDSIAADLGLGRSQFYRKIKALTNYSPVELMRNLRLKQSRTLLLGTDKSISEIAYQVGFSTPTYFTKCFRDFYGETPSDLRDKSGF